MLALLGSHLECCFPRPCHGLRWHTLLAYSQLDGIRPNDGSGNAALPAQGGWFADRRRAQQRYALTKKPLSSKKTGGKRSIGQEIITGLKQAIAWSGGERVPVRLTTVRVPTTDVRSLRRKLGLSQSEFAVKFGFQPATVKNWEQGRTKPDSPARVLLAVIARHPDAVEDALRQAG